MNTLSSEWAEFPLSLSVVVHCLTIPCHKDIDNHPLVLPKLTALYLSEFVYLIRKGIDSKIPCVCLHACI